MGQGIITGLDRNLEWMLPWWSGHYFAHNSYPVAFADFGMSQAARAFCQKRGALLPIDSKLMEKRRSAMTKKAWEKEYGAGVWQNRSAWFKKPLALLASPFEQGLWIDIDCKVQKELSPLLSCLAFGVELFLMRDEDGSHFLRKDEVRYNSGVIAFQRQAPILRQWIEVALEDAFPGDEECLSRAMSLHKPRFLEMPRLYNWFRDYGPNPEAFICHYCGTHGKISALEEMAASGQNGVIF